MTALSLTPLSFVFSCVDAVNAFSCLKHLRLSPVTSDAYWDFSIDELARYDVPAMVEQVLKVSG